RAGRAAWAFATRGAAPARRPYWTVGARQTCHRRMPPPYAPFATRPTHGPRPSTPSRGAGVDEAGEQRPVIGANDGDRPTWPARCSIPARSAILSRASWITGTSITSAVSVPSRHTGSADPSLATDRHD